MASKTDITLKLMQAENLSEVAKLISEFHEFEKIVHLPEKVRHSLEQLLRNDQLGRLWLIQRNAQTVGYIFVNFGFSLEYGGRDSFIDELYIREEFRGQGIGRTVVERVVDRVTRMGVVAMHLQVSKSNQPARSLYEKVGFEEREHKGRFFLTKPLTATT